MLQSESICSVRMFSILEDTAKKQVFLKIAKCPTLTSAALEAASPDLLTHELLHELIKLVEKIETLPNNHGPALLRQMADYILFNPALWCRAPAKVQIELQRFLATQFIQSKVIQVGVEQF